MFKKKINKNEIKEILIFSPVDGIVKDITEVVDQVFSQKMLGDGMVVTPTSNNFYSPSEGEIKVAFETGHAFGIQSISKPEILLHIGIDTVMLKGEGFQSKVKVGDKVKKETLLSIVNLSLVSKKVPSIDTIVIITQESISDFKIEKIAKINENIKAGEVLFKLIK